MAYRIYDVGRNDKEKEKTEVSVYLFRCEVLGNLIKISLDPC